jgi:hypothetical protein
LAAGLAKASGKGIVPEQLVVRGDDVLDLRAVLGLLQAQRVDQDALVRNGRGDALSARPAGGWQGNVDALCMSAFMCIENSRFLYMLAGI